MLQFGPLRRQGFLLRIHCLLALLLDGLLYLAFSLSTGEIILGMLHATDIGVERAGQRDLNAQRFTSAVALHITPDEGFHRTIHENRQLTTLTIKQLVNHDWITHALDRVE
ncbi:hypothetical protein D3C76_1151130 [compost metagenome]